VQTPAPPESFVVTIAQTPADEVTLAEVIFGSFGLVGALTALAIVLGAAMSFILVVWHKRHRPEADHMPSVAPSLSTPSDPQSSQAR
jgi:hypothetical protein